MSLPNWLGGTATKKLDTEEVTEVPQPSNGHNGCAVTFRPDPVYPLVVDPALMTAGEHFGILRTRVLSAHLKSGIRTLMVTSPQKEEGKSLVCVNLAIALGQLEKCRVLLIDSDLRVKGITRLLGMEDESGLGEYLQGKSSFEDSIHPTNLSHVSVAAAGQFSEESLPAILEGPLWPQFLETAKQYFDLIIVDSVPVAVPIADSELLASPCDGVLLIIHLRKTRRDALQLTARQLDSKLIGVVINNFQLRTGYDYYSYYNRKKNGM